jgi:hypothetical protein
MRWARSACLLVAVAACGDNLPADGFRGGSRLRAQFLTDRDGARQFETFHDPWLGIDCRFQGDPPRCLPEVARLRGYLDPDCTEPYVSRGVTDDACVPLPTHFGDPIEDVCSTEPSGFQRIWKRGERVTPETTYVIDGGLCVPREARIDYEYYAAEVDLPVEVFVTAEREISGVHRLRDVVLVGDDGSEQPIGFFDDVLGAECSVDVRLGLCVPEMVPTPFFSDPTCTWPLGTWTTAECDALPDFVGWYTPDGALEIFARGEPFVPVWAYFGTSGSCVASQPAADAEYFRKEERVLDDLAATGDTLTGTGRLGAYRDGGFHDRELGASCTAVQTGPERWHCLPDLGATATTFFADPLCEQAVAVFEQRASAPRKATRGIVWRTDGCERHARVHRIGSEIDSGDLYESRLLGCQRLSWNRAELLRYAVGDEVSLDEYVSLRRMAE